MKLVFLSVFFLFSQSLVAGEFDYSTFIKRCGWGTLWGAGAGLLTLAFEDHPYDHFNNVAKGASLGLYGGIIYGMTVPPEYQPAHLEQTPVESTQIYFNHDWKLHSDQLLWVYRF